MRADIVASAGDATQAEIDGRVTGRLETLSTALLHTWKTGRILPDGKPVIGIDKAPPAAKELHKSYTDETDEIRYRWNGEDCNFASRFLHLTRITRACPRFDYEDAAYEHDGTHDSHVQAAADTAALYFPEEYRERFIDLSGGDFKYANRTESIADNEGRKAPMVASTSTTASVPPPVPRKFAFLAFVALVALAALFRLIARIGGKNKHKVNRINRIEDLYLFDRRGRVIDKSERTRIDTHTSTSNNVGGYLHEGTGYIGSTTTTTTTTSTTHHQTLFLREHNGNELEVEFVDLDFSVRNGNHVAIVYAGDKCSQRGHPMAAVNLDTGKWAVQSIRFGWIAAHARAASSGCFIAAFGVLAYIFISHWGLLVGSVIVGFITMCYARAGLANNIGKRVKARAQDIANGR